MCYGNMTTIFAYWNSRTCTTYVYQLLCWYLFVNYVTTMFHLMYLAIRKLEHLSASIHVVYNANNRKLRKNETHVIIEMTLFYLAKRSANPLHHNKCKHIVPVLLNCLNYACLWLGKNTSRKLIFKVENVKATNKRSSSMNFQVFLN